MKTGAIAFLMLTIFSGEALAADAELQCGNPNPRTSPIWMVFDTYVKDTYNPGFVYSDAAYGHALGRLATAVKGDPEREQGFACVLFALEQKFGFATVALGNDVLYKRMMLAAMGGRDEFVAQTFKVTDTTPLTEVFTAAFRLSGRNPSNGRSSPTQTGQSQPVIKSDTAESFGLSSTAPTKNGKDKSCETGDRWSLAEAKTFISAAGEKREKLRGNCTKDNWFICKEIEQDLLQARDHIFQVFDQNHDGIANCRLCNYDKVLAQAKKLIEWEKWLGDRYYHASGLSTIYHTIQDNSDDPICRIEANRVPPVVGEGDSGKGNSEKDAAHGYVVDRVEIPKPSYRTTGSIICEIQISQGSRLQSCKHHKDEAILKIQIQHGFRLRAEKGDIFVPGEKVYLEIDGSISGYSNGYSIGDYVAASFEPRGGKFTIESKSGDGDGWSMNNVDLPIKGRERRGSASMHVTTVATFPDLKGKPVKIVLTGSNSNSILTYHHKPAN